MAPWVAWTQSIVGENPNLPSPEQLAKSEEEERVREEDRVASLRERMANQDLWDAVLRFALSYARRHRPRQLPEVSVTEFLNPVDPAALEAAQVAAVSLVRAAYDYGDRVLRKEKGVLETAMAEHPGFSVESVGAVIEYGCWQAR